MKKRWGVLLPQSVKILANRFPLPHPGHSCFLFAKCKLWHVLCLPHLEKPLRCPLYSSNKAIASLLLVTSLVPFGLARQTTQKGSRLHLRRSGRRRSQRYRERSDRIPTTVMSACFKVPVSKLDHVLCLMVLANRHDGKASAVLRTQLRGFSSSAEANVSSSNESKFWLWHRQQKELQTEELEKKSGACLAISANHNVPSTN